MLMGDEFCSLLWLAILAPAMVVVMDTPELLGRLPLVSYTCIHKPV